ncbi:hypothetical protein BJX65DRAFT_302053 [Aspergillus insuetus]
MCVRHNTTRPVGNVRVKSKNPLVCIICGARVDVCCSGYVSCAKDNQGMLLPDGSVIPAARIKTQYPWICYSLQSTCYFRIVTKDPKTQQLSVSEIGSPSAMDISGWTLRARFQNPTGKCTWWRPSSIDTACILYREQTHPQPNRRKEFPASYAVHVDCWGFLDRIIGHDIVQRHWDTFIDIVQEVWLANMGRFGCRYANGSRGWSGYRNGRVAKPQDDTILPFVALKHDASVFGGYNRGVHADSGQLGLPDMHELAGKVLRQPQRSDLLATAALGLAHVDIPVEFAIMIVEIVRRSRTDRLEGVRDTRNMLAAFEWRLPDAYWISRSNGHLKFEMQRDALDGNVNWEKICLDIEEMWLSSNDCGAATKNRAQTLGSLGTWREFFLREVEKETTQPENLAKRVINQGERRPTFRVLGCRRVYQR